MSILGNFDSGVIGKIRKLRTDVDGHSTDVTGAVHGATSANTINMILRRDSNGRVDVVAPSSLADNTTKVPTTAWIQSNLALKGTVTSVATGTGLTGGPFSSVGTISLANTAVAPNTYTFATLTVDQQGRLTAASSGSIPVANTAQQGIVERATQGEVDSGLDVARFVTPETLTGWSFGPVRKVKSVNEAVASSTVLQDDDTLNTWNLATAGWYLIEAFLIVQQGAGDLKYNFQFTNVPTSYSLTSLGFDSAGTESNFHTSVLATDTAHTVFGNTTDIGIHVRGVFRANNITGGSVDFQWAQNTSDAANTLMRAGSWMTLTRILP